VPGLDKTALFTHVRGAVRPEGREAGDVHIITFDEGWFWLIPFAGDVTSVGAVCSSAWLSQREPGEPLDALFDRTLARSGVTSERIAGAERLRPVAALADFSYRIDRLTGDGWLFVGDAAGFLDPLFSTGAHLAMKGGLLAAQAIDRALADPSCASAELAAYEGAVRHAVDLFLGVVQGFYKGGVREAIFEERQRTTLRKLVTTILAGDVFHGAEPPPWTAFVRSHYPPDLPPP
jgi:2-polyprenyl-6-methoxyphenol hydroxylase-like FAD-dependent oxidoreductase